MGIDDELTIANADAKHAIDVSSEQLILQSLRVAALARLPLGIGDFINSLLSGIAAKRNLMKVHELFDLMGARLRQVEKSKVSPEFFKSEEFQSLLFQVLFQLQMTHDRAKIALLAAALANSGTADFTEDDRKEMFIRALRELTPLHIEKLKELAMPSQPRVTESHPMQWRFRRAVTNPGERDLLIFQQLASDGLVEEILKPDKIYQPMVHSGMSQQTAMREFDKILSSLAQPPLRSFRLSELGRDFLMFVSATRE